MAPMIGDDECDGDLLAECAAIDRDQAVAMGRALAGEMILELFGADDDDAKAIMTKGVTRVWELAQCHAVICENEDLRQVVHDAWNDVMRAWVKSRRMTKQ